MLLKEALWQLMCKRKWYEKAGLSRSYAGTIKDRFKKGYMPTDEWMRKILIKCGYRVLMPEQWDIPPPEPTIIERIVRRKARERKKPKPKEIVIVRTLIEPEIVQRVTIKNVRKKKYPDIESEYSTKGKLIKKPNNKK